MILSLTDVSFKYVERPILDKTGFVLNEKEKWGVVGVNGSGKSTILKIMAGLQKVDSGEVEILKKYSISYCPQQQDFNEDLTVMESVKQLVSDAEDYEIKTILNTLQLFDYQRKVALLSGGQKKRLSLAISLIRKADLYLLDEPTNHLDQQMILWLENYLINMKAALIMVTHDRYFLNRITNHMLEIDAGKLYSYQGNYADYLEQREIRYQNQLSAQAKRMNFLRTEIEWIRAGAPARSTKSKSRIERFEAIASIEKVQEKSSVDISSVSSRLGGKIIEINNISKSYDKVLFTDFTDKVSKNDRIGIIGNNGCGKTTLLKTILGQVTVDSGNVEIGETVKIGYFGQDNTAMDESLRIIDYIKEYGSYVETSDHTTISASQMLEKFLFIKDDQYNYINRCSGGEKRRLYLCRILMEAPNVLILDEPTNDLDTDTLTILEDYLETFKGAVIAVSHDRYFVDKTCNRLWVFNNGRIENVIDDYSSYLEKNVISVAKKEPVEKKQAVSYTHLPSLTTKEKNELAKLPDLIMELEEQISELEEKLSTVSDYQSISAISEQLQQKRDEYDLSSLRWLELSEKEEEIKRIRAMAK